MTTSDKIELLNLVGEVANHSKTVVVCGTFGADSVKERKVAVLDAAKFLENLYLAIDDLEIQKENEINAELDIISKSTCCGGGSRG